MIHYILVNVIRSTAEIQEKKSKKVSYLLVISPWRSPGELTLLFKLPSILILNIFLAKGLLKSWKHRWYVRFSFLNY